MTNTKFRITISWYWAFQACFAVSCPLLTPEELFRARMVFHEGKQQCYLSMVTYQSHLELQPFLKGFKTFSETLEAAKPQDSRVSHQSKDPWQNKGRLVRETASGSAHRDCHRWPLFYELGEVLERTKLFSMGKKKKKREIWAKTGKSGAFQANGPTLQGQETSFPFLKTISTYIYIMWMSIHRKTQEEKDIKTSPWQDPRSSLGLHLFLEKFSLNKTT